MNDSSFHNPYEDEDCRCYNCIARQQQERRDAQGYTEEDRQRFKQWSNE